jgi:hypothetical protein
MYIQFHRRTALRPPFESTGTSRTRESSQPAGFEDISKRMGVPGFFTAMLWHLLNDTEYQKWVRLNKQGALHLWK